MYTWLSWAYHAVGVGDQYFEDIITRLAHSDMTSWSKVFLEIDPSVRITTLYAGITWLHVSNIFISGCFHDLNSILGSYC
jgi:hypothetical protein